MQVNPQGTPISETIDNGQSVSVPSGDVWYVTIYLGTQTTSKSDTDSTVDINGVPVLGDKGSGGGSPVLTTVLTGGDTVTADTNSNGVGAHIGGFEVSNVVDNTPVSITLENSSTTVPSGETWRVTIAIGNQDDGRSDTDNMVAINNVGVMGVKGGAEGSTVAFESTIVTDGDTIENNSNSNNGAHIGGFKI